MIRCRSLSPAAPSRSIAISLSTSAPELLYIALGKSPLVMVVVLSSCELVDEGPYPRHCSTACFEPSCLRPDGVARVRVWANIRDAVCTTSPQIVRTQPAY